MKRFHLIQSSLFHYFKSHLGVTAGVALAGTVLIGALVTGDSIRSTLKLAATERLGKITAGMATGDRYFRAQLAQDIYNRLSWPAASILSAEGVASKTDGTARALQVQVLGIDDYLSSLTLHPHRFSLNPGEVLINDRLAKQLHIQKGDSIILRIPKPSLLSRDAPISPQENSTMALRLIIKDFVKANHLGNFNLRADAVPPFNAFVNLKFLQQQLEMTNRANLMVISAPSSGEVQTSRSTDDELASMEAALQSSWSLEDAQLELRHLPTNGCFELRSSRIFLESYIADAAMAIGANPDRVLTYLVNELRNGTNITPYSMVAALEPPRCPPDMKDNETIINQWLADDLKLKIGNELEMRYYVVGPFRSLIEKIQKFRVRDIVSMDSPYSDRELMPNFPGISNSENCRDWDAGFPINLELIREKDETYWKTRKGTPKAFISLKAGQSLWTNRFGVLTSVRFPAASNNIVEIRSRLESRIRPAQLGMRFEPVRAQALAASTQGQDFGQLFLGFSFFLIAGALILTSLLFSLALQQRYTDVGILRACGYTPGSVGRLFLLEAGLLASIGACFGLLGGLGYAKLVLYGLSTIWRDAIGGSVLHFDFSWKTLLIGFLLTTSICWGTVAWGMRKLFRHPVLHLLSGNIRIDSGERRQKSNLFRWMTLSSAGLGCMFLVIGSMNKEWQAGAFFGSGGCWLITSIFVYATVLKNLENGKSLGRISIGELNVRNIARHPSRSLAVITMLAIGTFLMVAVGANKSDPTRNAEKRSSGTGGFSLIADSVIPLVQDLNSAAGKDFYGIDEELLKGVQITAMRVRAGDEASCLNLNRAQTPRLLGVPCKRLHDLGAFSFSQVQKGASIRHAWLLLNEPLNDNAIPAIGDENSIRWALGKKIGDEINITDEAGSTRKLRLVAALSGSMMQGSLMISEENFVQLFPSASGYQSFLIDTPLDQINSVSEALSRSLQDYGFASIPTVQKLAAFQAVQNTYLSTFLVLGGLGLLLGITGVGILIWRNAWERRGEWAQMAAIGYSHRILKSLALKEQTLLIFFGISAGLLTAILAVFPALMSPGVVIPYATIIGLMILIAANGLFWTFITINFAVKKDVIIEILREDG